MPHNTLEDLKIRIDLLQDKIWAIEDKVKREIEYIASQVAKLKKLNLKIEINTKRIEALENRLSRMQ